MNAIKIQADATMMSWMPPACRGMRMECHTEEGVTPRPAPRRASMSEQPGEARNQGEGASRRKLFHRNHRKQMPSAGMHYTH